MFSWISDATRATESLVTVELRAGDGATEVVVTHERLPDVEALASHTEGWRHVLGELAKWLIASRPA